MSANRKLLIACQDLLEQVAEYCEERQDTVDGSDGSPRPNWAMSMLQDIDELLPRVRAAIKEPTSV